MRLSDKVALVTGSSQGSGRASALRYAQAGADVIINYNRGALAASSTALQQRGWNC